MRCMYCVVLPEGDIALRTMGAAILALALGGCAVPQHAQPKTVLMTPTMERWAERAHSPAEHAELAAMYERHAAITKASAEQHRRLAAFYRSLVPTRGADRASMAVHCERLADLYMQASEENMKLAAFHRQTADLGGN